MKQVVTILAPRGRDAAVIEQVLRRENIKSGVVEDTAALVSVLGASSAVMITEEALAGEAMPALLDWVERQPPWSDLAFMVLTTKQAGVRSAAQGALLDRLGNATLLERPLNAEILVSAARSALRARRRQLAMRELAETLESRVEQRTRDLAETEARFRATFESFSESLYVVQVTPDGQFLMEGHNPTAERRTGVASADIVGKPIGSFLPPAHAAVLIEKFKSCLAAAASIEFTVQGVTTAGPATFDTVLTPMRDAEGRINRLLGVSRDVTARNQLEERLRSAQKLEAIGQLTGGVAHDFNNLLQVVISGLTLMERVQDPSRRTQLADSVRRAAERGGELTKRLLTVARRQSLRPEPVSLHGWFTDGAGDLLSRTLRGDIRTELHIPADLPAVEVDPAELELSVLNLAVNSRDAMPTGGTLAVSAEVVELLPGIDLDGLAGRFVRLSVQDTGSGMTPEVQARVFEPFYTTKEVGKGTGLGLAQVYGFARQSGGGVRLRSAPGDGTTVSLYLPVSERQVAEAHIMPPPETDAAPAARAAVLVCEDDDEVAALVVDMLMQLGHRPTRVSTAAAALGALADDRAVDLLFTDILMPGGMDGLALAQEAARRRPGLPVLLTTGYTGSPAGEPIGLPVLRKPYRMQDLAEAVRKALAA